MSPLGVIGALRRRPALRFIAAFLALAGATQAAFAAAGAWNSADFVAARLVSALDGVGERATVPLGIELKIKPGWKTYWRSPGDAGLAPTMDWAGSENLKNAAFSWPKPHRFELFGLQTFGYADHVVFPVAATLVEPGRPLALKGRLDVLVCEKICVPHSLDLALTVPAGPAMPGAEAQTVNRFESEVPGDGRASGLTIERAEAAFAAGKPALRVTASAREPFSAPDVFAEMQPEAPLGPPQVSLSDDRKRAEITLPLVRDLPAGTALAGRPATLTLVDGERSAEARTTVVPGAGGASEGRLARFATMLGLALLGGFILNLMPCVLPVLSLKLLSAVGQGGAAPAKVRAGFLASSAGIVFSFLVIAAGLIALKAGGRTIGWGIQFQQPAFIAVMVVVVTLFAANLWGLFEVPMPAWIGRAASLGSSGEGLIGHFATGAFATLLATPCSAPFLGTAVGFALAGGPAEIIAIFAALGIGLALPYLAVAAFPKLATALPRPGRWMLHLRRILGLALAATAMWLLTIMAAQLGWSAALLVGALMAALLAALGLRHAAPGRLGRAGASLAVALALAGIIVPIMAEGPVAGARKSGGEQAIRWVAFDRNAIRSLVSQGRIVFVDVTADWCITCKANKRLVIDGEAVARRLSASVVAMQADWTRPDPKISEFLAAYGRYGIPFNVVYGPGRPAGVVLPELLTEAAVLEALDQAAGAPRDAAAEIAPATAGRSFTAAPSVRQTSSETMFASSMKRAVGI